MNRLVGDGVADDMEAVETAIPRAEIGACAVAKRCDALENGQVDKTVLRKHGAAGYPAHACAKFRAQGLFSGGVKAGCKRPVGDRSGRWTVRGADAALRRSMLSARNFRERRGGMTNLRPCPSQRRPPAEQKRMLIVTCNEWILKPLSVGPTTSSLLRHGDWAEASSDGSIPIQHRSSMSSCEIGGSG